MSLMLNRAYAALWRAFGDEGIARPGYVQSIPDNLLPEIEFRKIREELEQGAGNELNAKFLAVHSSTALVVNSFGIFKSDQCSTQFEWNGDKFAPPQFERQCRTGLGGTPPNIDVWFSASDAVVAIESKLTEYFTPKQAFFADSYTRENLPYAEDCWWTILEDSKDAGKRYLDVAQLVKHYLGLRRHMCDGGAGRIELLYVFWEPANANQLDCCVQHREEISALIDAVSGSAVTLAAISYSDLWRDWDSTPALKTHVANLRARYDVEI
ncbi:hypothetical protein Poly24_16390 [Rosistilla carotiformis]|uniref:Uncharacterized protein n=1 Tax=Rosistilla carotiformis TaxID=2528017 RepID=A0A518JQW4_9BACT|nr:hypothetical protein [Rosistilla carotiformis]QDV67933.1 hypothetical protein Poly24_16390 [Rosistilla carotiformis]